VSSRRKIKFSDLTKLKQCNCFCLSSWHFSSLALTADVLFVRAEMGSIAVVAWFALSTAATIAPLEKQSPASALPVLLATMKVYATRA
jgi:hypothetical protein